MRAALSSRVSAFHERDFFRDRFTPEELRSLAGNRPLSELFSARSPSIAKLGLDAAAMTEAQMLEWMIKEPRLIRRPLLLVDGKLVVQSKSAELVALLS